MNATFDRSIRKVLLVGASVHLTISQSTINSPKMAPELPTQKTSGGARRRVVAWGAEIDEALASRRRWCGHGVRVRGIPCE